MLRTTAMNSASREPASHNMAAFTVAPVVSGPGVNSSLWVVMQLGGSRGNAPSELPTVSIFSIWMVGAAGLEPATLSLEG
jgi:hypothetical protein